jgi:uncharacterized membrane protein
MVVEKENVNKLAAETEMMNDIYGFIIENKWLILLVLEVFAWSATFFMFFARYKMQSDLWFKVASAMLIMTGFVPQILLGVINFSENKELDWFTLVLLLLVVYGATAGKNHVRKIDDWARGKFSHSVRED